jgi:hypothetical protein
LGRVHRFRRLPPEPRAWPKPNAGLRARLKAQPMAPATRRVIEAQQGPQGLDRPRGSFDLDSFSRSRPSQVVRIANFHYSFARRENEAHPLRGTLGVTAIFGIP